MDQEVDTLTMEKEVIKGDPTVVKPIGDFKIEYHDLIQVEHGYDVDSNYIWHFSSRTDKRCLPSNNKFLAEAVYTYLHKHIPSDCKVDVFFPNPSYDIKILTVKGHSLGKKWNFDENQIQEHFPELCKELCKRLEIPKRWSHMKKG